MSTQQYWVAEDDLCTILQEYFNTYVFPKNPQRVLHLKKDQASSGFLCEIEPIKKQAEFVDKKGDLP